MTRSLKQSLSCFSQH